MVNRIVNQESRIRYGVIVAILASSFLIPASLSSHGDVEHGELIIRMTENGFEPRDMTVTQGDEILFINNDDVDRWPASNFHPTHTQYSEFDPKGGVPPGESWKFMFEKPGIWRMHDHLIPHMTGTITVLEDTLGSATTTDLIGKSFWQKVKSFLSKIFKIKKNPQKIVATDHDSAHLRGQIIYGDYGLEGLKFCTPEFAFGCYHGLMEVAFDEYRGREKEYKEKIREADEGCRQIGPESSPYYWSCVHGIGHGTATFREHTLMLALEDCSLVGNAASYCFDGVFMEFAISAPPSFYDESNPIHPCDTVADKYKSACGRSQVQVMRDRFGMETYPIALACKSSGSEIVIQHCTQALGFYSAHTSLGEVSKVLSLCSEIQDDKLENECIRAAAGEFIFQEYVGWPEKSREICNGINSPERTSCFNYIEEIARSYGRI